MQGTAPVNAVLCLCLSRLLRPYAGLCRAVPHAPARVDRNIYTDKAPALRLPWLRPVAFGAGLGRASCPPLLHAPKFFPAAVVSHARGRVTAPLSLGVEPLALQGEQLLKQRTVATKRDTAREALRGIHWGSALHSAELQSRKAGFAGEA